MARFIVRLHDRYLEWSTIVDAPVTEGMDLETFRNYYLAEHGSDAEEFFDESVCIANENGASESYDWRCQNRAGPEETCLNEDELYRLYCLGQPLDEETLRTKIHANRARERRRDSVGPLPPHSSESEVRKAVDSLRLGEPLDRIESILGTGENISRKRGLWLKYRWIFAAVTVTCHFERPARTLSGVEVAPKYNA